MAVESFDAVLLQDASDRIGESISSGTAFVGRVGETELAVWRMVYESNGALEDLKTRLKAKINAGIWPPTRSGLLSFSLQYESAFRRTTAVGAWGTLRAEQEFLDGSAPTAERIPLRALDPVLLAAEGMAPWSTRLEGKRVLVVAPFADTAVRQVAKKRTMFRSDFEVLPNIEVLPLVPPQTQGLEVGRASWSTRLRQACLAVEDVAPKADVALLSAGSYGMPLAAHAAACGLPTVYVGGALQLLFGIEGARWSNSAAVAGIRGNGWVRLPNSKAPRGARLIERGAYW